MGLRIGPACEAGLSTSMQREYVPSQRRKRKKLLTRCHHVSNKIDEAFVSTQVIWTPAAGNDQSIQRLHIRIHGLHQNQILVQLMTMYEKQNFLDFVTVITKKQNDNLKVSKCK